MKTLKSTFGGQGQNLLVGLSLLAFLPVAAAVPQINFVLLLFVPPVVLGVGMLATARR